MMILYLAYGGGTVNMGRITYAVGQGKYSVTTSPRISGVTRYYNRKVYNHLDLRGVDYIHTDTQIAKFNSPYAINFRLFGEKETRQRAPVISRLGAERVNQLIDVDTLSPTVFPPYASYDYVNYNREVGGRITNLGKMIGVRLVGYNPKGCAGYLRVSVNKIAGGLPGEEITHTTFDTEKLQINNWGEFSVYFPTGVSEQEVFVLIRLVDDFNEVDCGVAQPKPDCVVHIGLQSTGNHVTGMIADAPNTCTEDRVATQYSSAQDTLIATPITTDSGETIGQKHYCCDGKDYSVWAVRTATDVKLYRTLLEDGTTIEIHSGIPFATKRVRFAQAGGDLYFVDGISKLKKYNCATGVVEVVSPTGQEAPIASLILFHENRLFLNDVNSPNKLVWSLIDDVAPMYNVYESTAFQHIPDVTPKQSSCGPIVALESFRSEVVIFVVGKSPYILRMQSGFDLSVGGLVETEGHYSPLSQENVSVGRNVIWFYTPKGLMFFTGAGCDKVSINVEPEFERMNEAKLEDIFVQFHDEKVRVYYARGNSTSNDHMMMYYTSYKEWVKDTESYVNGCTVDYTNGRLYEYHSSLPIMSRAENSFNNLGAEIDFHYYTPYFWFLTPSQSQRLHRIHALFLVAKEYTVDIGWDYQFKNKPRYSRKFVGPALSEPEIDENDDTLDGVYSGELFRKFSVKPSGRGCNSQVRVRARLATSQLELVGFTIEHDSADLK